MSSRGMIHYSTAPHESHWYSRAMTPLIAACNLSIAAWVYPSVQSSRIRWNPRLDNLFQIVRNRTRPIIYYSWHVYELSALCAFREHPSDIQPIPIGHDGILSCILQHAAAWFGYSIWVYRRQSPIRVKDQLIEYLIKESPIMGLFADSGGPDGMIKPGLIDVARESRAILIPFSIKARPKLIFPFPKKYTFPLPFSSIDVFWGEPMDGDTISEEQCQKALELQTDRAS